MVVPSRKSRMIQNFMKNQERVKIKAEIKNKEVSPEEHKERIELLEKMGLIKKDKKK